MPPSIATLRGSCVLIPCQFEVGYYYRSKVKNLETVSWIKGSPTRYTVLESNGYESDEYSVRGNVTGNFRVQNCTTILMNLQKDYEDNYHFRLGAPIHYTYRTPVKISVSESPPNPQVTPPAAVKEGSPVSFTCSAAAPCPTLPPALTWTQGVNGSVDQQEVENQDKTQSVSSVLTFTPSHLHHGHTITCTALYSLQPQNKMAEETATLDVLYSPKNTSASVSPSGSVLEGSSVTLTCSSNANPPVSNYTWFKVTGDQATQRGSGQNLTFNVTEPSDSGQYYCEAQNEHGAETSTQVTVTVTVKYMPRILNTLRCIKTTADITCQCEVQGDPSPTVEWLLSGQRLRNDSVEGVIKEELLGNGALRSSLTLRMLGETDIIECLSQNSAGSSRILFHIFSSGPKDAFSTIALLIGSAIGAVLMSLLCCLIQFIKNRRKNKPSVERTKEEDTAELMQINVEQLSPLQEEDIYANNTMLSEKRREEPRELQYELHYASLDFSKPQHEEGMSETEGTAIRGSSENHTDYAEVKCKPKNQGEEPAIPSQSEEGEYTVVHCPIAKRLNTDISHSPNASSEEDGPDGNEQELPPEENQYGSIKQLSAGKKEMETAQYCQPVE
ncbi:sialic acid-binding Ig-like lectin 5 isoform X2 [Amia ocellicauda]